MNMASIGILLIFTLCSVVYGSKFITIQCKTKNMGQHGQQSMLECEIHSTTDDKDLRIIVVAWKKKGNENPLLVVVKGVTTTQQPGYSFAVPSWNNRTMNVSLLITNTAVEHDGVYTCMVVTDRGDATNKTSLKVTAKYSVPTITSKPENMTQNTGGTLTCETDGGYPKGELRWFGENNDDWTRSSEMEEKQTESGLFRLSSKLTLLQRSSFPKYTCVVFNASGGKESATTFEIPSEQVDTGKIFNTKLPSKIVAPVVVIGSLIVGLLLVLLYRRRSHQARRQSTTPLMGDHEAVQMFEPEFKKGGLQEMGTKCQGSLA